MNLKKFLALALAAVMLLSLCACGKDAVIEADPNAAETYNETEQLSKAVGKLVILSDAEIQVAYDEDGNVLAVVGQNELGKEVDAAYSDFSGKACSQVVTELIDVIFEQGVAAPQGYIFIRQELGSTVPGDTFLDKVTEEAKLNKAGYRVVLASAADQDKNGQFSKETALAILNASLGSTEGMTVTCGEAPVSGSYSVTCIDANGVSTVYSISATTGTVTMLNSSDQSELVDPNISEDVPESDIFDAISDVDAAAGTDGGVDNGSV